MGPRRQPQACFRLPGLASYPDPQLPGFPCLPALVPTVSPALGSCWPCRYSCSLCLHPSTDPSALLVEAEGGESLHIRCPGSRVLTHTPPQASMGHTQSCSHMCGMHTSPPGLPPVSCHPALTLPAPLLCDGTVRSARVTGCPPVKASALAARTGQGWFLEAKISRGGAWTSSS